MKAVWKKTSMLLILVLLGSFMVAAQNSPAVTLEERQAANEYFTAQNWVKAIEAYESIAKRDPNNVSPWYRLGYSLHANKQFGRAVAAFEKAAAITPGPIILYNLACAYAMNGNADKSLETLEKAVGAGFANVGQLKTDTDLNTIRSNAKFPKLLETAERAARPCEYDARYRQFDFWIGEWEVRTQQGGLAGNNSIQKLENGCVLWENWTGQGGGSGKSMNFFDPGINKWRQVWMGANGGVLELVGEFREGNLYYEGELRNPNGTKQPNRLTFFKLGEGKVRQLGEQSSDGGKTWTVVYDFVYTLKKPLASESKPATK